MSNTKPENSPSVTGASQSKAAVRPQAQTIVLRDLVLQANIGVTSDERAEAQRICINIELEVEALGAPRDQIDAVISYSHLAKAVRAVCTEDSQTKLLETLAARIAEASLAHHGAKRVRIRIEKLDRYPDMSGVGIDMTFQPA